MNNIGHNTGPKKWSAFTAMVVLVFFLVLPGPGRCGESRFFFVQITDTHLGIPENNARARKIVAAVNRLPMTIQCVVHTGDVYDRSVWGKQGAVADAAEVFKPLKPPVYFLPGNHDIDLDGDRKKTMDTWVRHFSPLVYSRMIQGVAFVFAYTDSLREGVAVEGFHPFDALQSEIKTPGNAPVLLFHHGPSVPNFYRNRFHRGWADRFRREWHDLIRRNNVTAVITGHFHRDELHWLGHVPVYVSGPAAEKFGRQACFRIYEYNDGRLGYTAQYLD
ncbi:MAG: metallophosphoesterase [Desulfobacter sp.]